MFETFPDVLSVADICGALGIGRTKAYRLVNSGEIPSVKIGNAIRVPKHVLLDYISQKCYNSMEVGKHRTLEGG